MRHSFKVGLLAVVALAVMVGTSWAAWTYTSTSGGKAGHYKIWKVVCTGDNAEDTGSVIPYPQGVKQGDSLLSLIVVPGTGGVAPDTTIDLTLKNEHFTLWTKTGISNTAQSDHKLSTDILTYPPLIRDLTVVFNDIGATGDQVTLYFLIWEE